MTEERVGDIIRNMRQARGLSRAKLAELAGVSQFTIRAYENDPTHVPTDGYVDAIMWALDQYPLPDKSDAYGPGISPKRPRDPEEAKKRLAERKRIRSVDLSSEKVALRWKDTVLDDTQVATIQAVAKSLAEQK